MLSLSHLEWMYLMAIGRVLCKDSILILILQQNMQIIQNGCLRICLRNIFLCLSTVLYQITAQMGIFREQNSNKITKKSVPSNAHPNVAAILVDSRWPPFKFKHNNII